jgi:hypothetical protein
MLALRIEDVPKLSEADLADQIHRSGGQIGLIVVVPDLYQAQSRTELADNWLKIWYLAERLADHTESALCRFREEDFGAGRFEFDLTCGASREFAANLIEFASAFDPDDLEANALIYDEVEEWLEARGTTSAWFPNIEQHYRDDADSALVDEQDRGQQDDGDDGS